MRTIDSAYIIHRNGKIWSSFINRYLQACNDGNGYLSVNLKTNLGYKSFRVHRLVAITYLPNSRNLPEVNHINGVKSDNRLENLEWCTKEDNLAHYYKHPINSLAVDYGMSAQDKFNDLISDGVPVENALYGLQLAI